MLPDLEPFQYPAFLVLASLASGEKHGYAIIEDVMVSTGIALGPGTLYSALARLERQGLVEALPMESRRRPYRLTPRGGEMLNAQVSQWETFVTLGRTRLRLGEHP